MEKELGGWGLGWGWGGHPGPPHGNGLPSPSCSHQQQCEFPALLCAMSETMGGMEKEPSCTVGLTLLPPGPKLRSWKGLLSRGAPLPPPHPARVPGTGNFCCHYWVQLGEAPLHESPPTAYWLGLGGRGLFNWKML